MIESSWRNLRWMFSKVGGFIIFILFYIHQEKASLVYVYLNISAGQTHLLIEKVPTAGNWLSSLPSSICASILKFTFETPFYHAIRHLINKLVSSNKHGLFTLPCENNDHMRTQQSGISSIFITRAIHQDLLFQKRKPTSTRQIGPMTTLRITEFFQYSSNILSRWFLCDSRVRSRKRGDLEPTKKKKKQHTVAYL